MTNVAARHVPELDGLRGIAIIPVLIHHQLTTFSLKGGFLGVDLFFVLSGFLITGLLLAEFEKNASISIRKFYMRRVLRLGPGLAVYLISCLIVVYYTQLITITRQLKLIGITLVYSTNWRMAFGWDPVLDPTAIMWSLSIEEQFYLVWPLLLFVCLSLKFKRRLIAGGLVFVIISICIYRNVLLNTGVELTRLYYGSDTRADALLVGCFSAFIPFRRTSSKGRTMFGVVAIIAGLGFLYLTATASFGDAWLYRGGFTFAAVLSALVILSAANEPLKPLSLALQFFPLRWIGKISYGLYLWHYLVIQTTSLYYFGYWEPWAKLALAVGISATSFYVVERRFNRLKPRFASRADASEQTSSSSETSDEPIPSLTMSTAN